MLKEYEYKLPTKYTKETINGFVEDKFRQEFRKQVKLNPNLANDFNAYLKTHLKFITMTFRFSGNGISRNPQSSMFLFRGFYYRLIRNHLVGNHYSRRRDRQPLTLFSLDSEGSRLGGVNLARGTNIHVHALMLLHPTNVKPWTTVDWHQVKGPSGQIDDIHWEVYDPKKSPWPRLISYATKGLNPQFDQEIFWDFLP